MYLETVRLTSFIRGQKMKIEEMQAVIRALLESGALKEEDLSNAIKANPTISLKRLTDQLHLILCPLDHDTNCEYMMEELLENPFGEEKHLEWLDYAIAFSNYMSADFGEAARILSAIAIKLSEINSDDILERAYTATKSGFENFISTVYPDGQ